VGDAAAVLIERSARVLRGLIQFSEKGNKVPSRSNHRKKISLNVKLGIAMLLGVSAGARDVKLNVTYVCNGEGFTRYVDFINTSSKLIARR
jgi:hypothetical protein